MNELAERSRWYNALSHNCTTTIRHHAQAVGPSNPWDWRILANGRLDELLYERGTIDTSLPFADLRERSDITEKAKAAGTDPAFSRDIREGLPGFSRRSDDLRSPTACCARDRCGRACGLDFRGPCDRFAGSSGLARTRRGGRAWSNAPDSKSGVPARVPGVRIPPSPPRCMR